MKVKHTQNGNVKITLTLEQAGKLRKIVRFSAYLKSKELTDDSHESVSWKLFTNLNAAGVEEA